MVSPLLAQEFVGFPDKWRIKKWYNRDAKRIYLKAAEIMGLNFIMKWCPRWKKAMKKIIYVRVLVVRPCTRAPSLLRLRFLKINLANALGRWNCSVTKKRLCVDVPIKWIVLYIVRLKYIPNEVKWLGCINWRILKKAMLMAKEIMLIHLLLTIYSVFLTIQIIFKVPYFNVNYPSLV